MCILLLISYHLRSFMALTHSLNYNWFIYLLMKKFVFGMWVLGMKADDYYKKIRESKFGNITLTWRNHNHPFDIICKYSKFGGNILWIPRNNINNSTYFCKDPNLAALVKFSYTTSYLKVDFYNHSYGVYLWQPSYN